MHESRKSENSSWVVTPGGELVSREIPSMVDIFSGPNAPLATAFQMCGWQVAVLDKAIRSSDDLDSTARQQELRDQVQSVTFVAAAFDCSTKSRVRENPREFEDGRQTPGPPRSESHPEGLPSLRGAAKRRAERGNAVTHFILEPLEDHDARGGGSLREGPGRSLHWRLPKEQEMLDSGRWEDKSEYMAYTLY
jgi:hypothetical protein